MAIQQKVYVTSVLFASFIEMWAAGSICDQYSSQDGFSCDKEWGWAVSAGAISCILCIALLILDCVLHSKPWMAYIHMASALILTVIWVMTVSICTFEKPFAGIAGICTGGGSQQACSANGYMSSWVACAAAIGYLLKAVPYVHKLTEKIPKDGPKQLMGILFFASGLMMWHASYWCWKSNNNKAAIPTADNQVCKCDGLLLYALVCSSLSCLLTLLFGFVPKLAEYVKYFAAFMVLWWFCGVASLTFRSGKATCNPCWDCGVFYDANNGFFGTWISFFASFALVGATWGLKVGDGGETADGFELTPEGTATASAITQEGPGVEKNEQGESDAPTKDEATEGPAKSNEETSI